MKKNNIIINEKAQDLINIYFKKNYEFFELDPNDIINYLKNNNNDNNKIIIFFDNIVTDDDINILNFIKSIRKNFKLFIVIMDWWKVPDINREKQHYLIDNILKASDYKVIVSAIDLNQLCDFNGEDYSIYKNNIFYIQMWSAYEKSFCSFNKDPIPKILISGHINELCYPDRFKLDYIKNPHVYTYTYNLNDIYGINNNNYNIILNNYLCCFCTSVHLYNAKENKKKNILLPLLKIFEILAAGSLLLIPHTEECILNKLGLVKNIHYLIINLEKNIDEQINYIVNPDNREIINKIRYDGYTYCKNNLTTNNKFNEYDYIFKNY